ncbi:MAG: cation diffusion facilitator family transporter [Elusimicrobiota bacterium]|jgi:cation diffusion facilitator family transporter
MDAEIITTRPLKTSAAAHREKSLVAISSVAAAVLLTGTKLGIGLWTNSLGILSEAAHSGLDLLAAAVTCWAVHVSSRPADQDHPYGHGKFENLSALFETLLLVITCVWIFKESAHRLLFSDKIVDVNIWSFAVILLSIGVDWSRSRALMRVAKKYDSQALEADALHFSTDIWSSCVVLMGLAGVLLSERTGLAWLAKADSLAALCVGLIVLKVCWDLGRRSINDLLDAVPAGLDEQVRLTAQVPGVLAVKKVRVRKSGPELFAEITIAVPQGTPLESAHATADKAEASVQTAFPKADVLVHVEPDAALPLDVPAAALALAARHGFAIHGLRLYEEDSRRAFELHLEVDPALDLRQAHARADEFEALLRAAFPDLSEVRSHIEPAGDSTHVRKARTVDEGSVRDILEDFLRERGFTARLTDVCVRSVAGENFTVSLSCRLPGKMNIRAAHDLTEEMERRLRDRVRNLGRILIHLEPPE